MASSDEESTNKRKTESSSSEASFPGKRIRLHSPTMAGSQTVAGPSSTLPETMPETAQLQQQDDSAVPEAEPENVQQQDADMVEAEPENDQQQDGPHADNLEGYAFNDVVEAQPAAPAPAPAPAPASAPAHRREILVLTTINYIELNLSWSSCNHVGAVLASECISWLHLARRIRDIYNRVVDQQAAADIDIPRGYISPTHSWPGRIVWFLSSVDGAWVQRNWLEDDWVGLDIANNLYAILLELPQGRTCRIVEGFADGTEGQQLDRIVIHNLPSWEAFTARIREVYYTVLLEQVVPELEVEELSPFNCCPGADVTFWGDLREQWFCRTRIRDNYDQQTWLEARMGICKVRITRI